MTRGERKTKEDAKDGRNIFFVFVFAGPLNRESL